MIKRIIDVEAGIKEAENNLKELKKNSYPGRVIILGKISGNLLVIIYCLMGRSDNSRNRQFKFDEKNGRLWTDPIDPSKVQNPDLVIYNAMRETDGFYFVSNGKQTDALYDEFSKEKDFSGVLNRKEWGHEPDDDHTPRITGIITLTNNIPTGDLFIAKKSPQGEGSDYYRYLLNEFKVGYGVVISTYDGDGKPLPSFSKEAPYFILLDGNEDTIMKFAKGIFKRKNTVSVAIKFIDPTADGISWIKVWNKFKKKEK